MRKSQYIERFWSLLAMCVLELVSGGCNRSDRHSASLDGTWYHYGLGRGPTVFGQSLRIDADYVSCQTFWLKIIEMKQGELPMSDPVVGRMERRNGNDELIFEDGWSPQVVGKNDTLILTWRGADGRVLVRRMTREPPEFGKLCRQWEERAGTSLADFYRSGEDPAVDWK